MQRREMDRRQESRREAEREASQPTGGQPQPDDEADELQKPEETPNFLTARELEARVPAGDQQDAEKPLGERRTLKERRRNPG